MNARVAVASVVLLLSIFSFSQTSSQPAPNQSSTQAQTLISQAASASFGSVAVSDVTLTGTVTSHFGVDDSGNFTLQATSSGAAKLQTSLGAGGSRTEVYTPWAASPACSWIGADGAKHQIANHNCFAVGSWFFPLLPLTQSQKNMLVAYVGAETRNSAPVQHLVIGRNSTGNDTQTDSLINRVSTSQLYLDASSNLPVAYTYFVHPDKDAGTDIPIEVRYSDYRDVNGVKVPFHIDQLMNGTIVLELSITSATFNTGTTAQ